jgi:hypothetical protein
LISAKDKKTGEVLKCEARVAKIDSIKIITRHKVLLVNEIDTLEVQAFDSIGNVFSSLQGISFVWKVTTNPSFIQMLSLS